MKANHTSLFYITLLIIGSLSVSCSNQSKDKVAAFEDISPDYKKKETTSHKNQDTLLPYLTRYINDSVGLVFDSIQLDERLHFLDRFSNGKKPNRNHFELSNSSGKTLLVSGSSKIHWHVKMPYLIGSTILDLTKNKLRGLEEKKFPQRTC